jgi:hypothetical protein
MSYRWFPRAARLLLLFALPAVSLGCTSGPPQMPVFPVKGAVFVGGKPAARALVTFHPLTAADPKVPRPTGEVDDAGAFVLSTYTTGDGAPAGEYAITVYWPGGSSPIGGDADSEGDRLGKRYADPATTPLRARVNEAPTELAPFQLK